MSSNYLHIVGGRLRIKIVGLKHSPGRAAIVESELRSLKGVKQVNANPLTGNLLVLFDPGKMSHQRIIDSLRKRKYLTNSERSSRAADSSYNGLERALGALIIKLAIEAALNRLMVAII